MANLTEKEVDLMKAALMHVEGGHSSITSMINFEKVYPIAGYKDAKNCKIMFGRLLQKMQGGKTTNGSSSKTPKGSKPQGVTKAKLDIAKAKARRGRPKQKVEDVFASDVDEDNNADGGVNDDEESALQKEEAEEAKAGVRYEEI